MRRTLLATCCGVLLVSGCGQSKDEAGASRACALVAATENSVYDAIWKEIEDGATDQSAQIIIGALRDMPGRVASAGAVAPDSLKPAFKTLEQAATGWTQPNDQIARAAVLKASAAVDSGCEAAGVPMNIRNPATGKFE